MKKTDIHQFQGMQRDRSISKQQAQFLWEANNIRLTAREGDTLLSITNEKGCKQSVITGDIGTSIIGAYVGHCVIGDYLTVFTHASEGDYIFRLHKEENGEFTLVCLTGGSAGTCTPLQLGFDVEHPLQTLAVYENKYIQKIYWTDGINQPRMINIVKDSLGESFEYSKYSFDFVPKMQLDDSISVRKIADSSGSFGAGVIQYMVSYYNKYGQESNLSCSSCLIGTSFYSRAGSEDEKIGNSFEITIKNPDTSFEYVRIYSVFRSSINATASCKRVVDIKISDGNSKEVRFVDNGTIGDDVDPEEMLYIGGESITAETIEQKDGTLFLGNIKIKRAQISEELKTLIANKVTGAGNGSSWSSQRYAMLPNTIFGESYSWGNSLNAKVPSTGMYDNTATNYDESLANISTAGFKSREHYRLGVQFQYNTGKWSEPIFLGDKTEETLPDLVNKTKSQLLTIPNFAAKIDAVSCKELIAEGYVRARAIVTLPIAQERLVIAQGMLAPTVYSIALRENHCPDIQSSWYFRLWPVKNNSDLYNELSTYVLDGAAVQYKHNYSLFGFNNRGAEIQGVPIGWGGKEYKEGGELPYGDTKKKISLVSEQDAEKLLDSNYMEVGVNQCINIFCVDQQNATMHSPEFEFDTSFASLDLVSVLARIVGQVRFSHNTGNIDIITETPSIGNNSTGFYHRMLSTSAERLSSRKLCAGLFYWDFFVDEDKDGNNYRQWPEETTENAFMVYPWHRSGSLNNDCNRPSGSGTRSAVLSTKKISNITFSTQTIWIDPVSLSLNSAENNTSSALQLFDSDQVSITKVNNLSYYGNVDMILTPPASYGITGVFGKYSGEDNNAEYVGTEDPNFDDAHSEFFVGVRNGYGCVSSSSGILNPSIYHLFDNVGDSSEGEGLRMSKETVRMKYKSTPHVIMHLSSPLGDASSPYPYLYMAELYRKPTVDTDFGGTSDEAKQANLWIPAGEPVKLEASGTVIHYDYGDTWYQRYDCLKTYPFTEEDTNSMVEIGSFMVETHVNLDGRYDKNRGQDDNINIRPTNFNLINTVYSQTDNFFNYRLLDGDYYNLKEFTSMITWSTAKSNASDVDPWTSITLASTLEVDGARGEVTDIVAFKDLLYAFQERGITQVLFNSRVAISTSDNVPIEISNNYKVDGNRYISTAVGCANKFAVTKSSQGVYFVDDIGKTLYLLNGDQLANISDTDGLGYWFSQQDTSSKWIPYAWQEKAQSWRNGKGIALYYDFNKKDLYLTTVDRSLCFSELLGQFVSYLNYQGGILFNVGDTFQALTTRDESTTVTDLWDMFEGMYNHFFYKNYETDITFISNADVQLDKTFTNLEIRGDFYNENEELQHERFFDSIRVWNEYQDTQETNLVYKFYPYTTSSVVSNLKKKFRIWRCDIPRAWKDNKRSMDRIRNTWCKVKLVMNKNTENPLYMEMHDVNVVYYI